MADKDARDSEGRHPVAAIIDFAPRRRLRQRVNVLLAVMQGSEQIASQARRLVTEANALFGAELVTELQRVVARDMLPRAASAIALLLLIAGDAAQAALWAIALDEALHPALRLDALRGLYQQGERVAVADLVALANACGAENEDD